MTGTGAEPAASQRVDKWLWVARFFKTRSLAAQAVSGGKVEVDGARVKPARRVRPGDRLRVHRGASEWLVVVRALAAQRQPAKDAVLLYEETAESLERRTSEAERRRQAEHRRQRRLGRPDKHDRREIARFKAETGGGETAG